MSVHKKDLLQADQFAADHDVVSNEDIHYPKESHEQGSNHRFNDHRGSYYFDIRIL
jgi:hypothetical protein